MSDLCDEFDNQRLVVWRWEKQLFENGAGASERSKDRTAPLKRRIAA
jgi:hypothetical protein